MQKMRKTNYTSMIIGFPSFIAFFKSPAKPRKEEKSSSKYFAKQTDERSTFNRKMSKMQGVSSRLFIYLQAHNDGILVPKREEEGGLVEQ